MSPMADEPIVTVATYMNLAEADLARGKLQAEGIEAWLSDDNMLRMDWFYGNFLNGVKLQVKQEDAERAWEVLAEGIPPELQDEQAGGVFEQPKCPKCGSLDVSRVTFNRKMSYTLMYFGLPYPVPTTEHWLCEECGVAWIDDGAEGELG